MFPLTRTDLRPAWRVRVSRRDTPDVFESWVDAVDGRVLKRRNLTRTFSGGTEPASFRVFPTDSPAPGTPGTATIPDTGILNRPRQDRDAARAFTLTIPAPGQYTCTATPARQGGSQGRRVKMMLIQNGTMVEEVRPDFRTGVATLSRQLQGGQYVVRVWESIRRGANITVACNPG